MKLYTLLVICAFSIATPAFSDNSDWVLPYDDTYKNATNLQDKHLYISTANQIVQLKLDTVTYYFTSSKPNEILYDSFKEFADDIGKKDGAVFIPLNNEALLIFKEMKHKQNRMYKYTKISDCDFSKVIKNSVLFEIRDLSLKQEDRCIHFPVKNDALWLASSLKKLNKNLISLKKNSDLTELKKESIIATLMNGIDATVDGGTLEKNKSSIRKMANWLSNLF